MLRVVAVVLLLLSLAGVYGSARQAGVVEAVLTPHTVRLLFVNS